MSGLYIIVGLIVVTAAVFMCIGVGMLTKYSMRKYDLMRTYTAEDSRLYSGADDEVPNFLLGAFVIVMLSIAIGLIVAITYHIGQTLVNAIA